MSSTRQKKCILTLPQIKLLVFYSFEERILGKSDAVTIVSYFLKRNHTAYKSHRKKKLEKYQNLIESGELVLRF